MLRNHIKEAIRRKRRGLLSSRVCLQGDNARPHTARHTVKQILDLKFGGVTPSAMFTKFGTQRLSLLFGTLKAAVRGRHIRSDEEVKKAVQERPSQHPKDVFSRGIYTLPERWSRCVEGGGDYIED